jgi:hypothetical protein
MTRTISLIIGIATVVLTVAVPTAFAEGRLAGSQEQTAVAPDWFERAAIAAQNQQRVLPDSADLYRPVTSSYVDAAARADRIDTIIPTVYVDAFERSAPPKGSVTTSVAASGSGVEFDWQQLGIGFGVGLVLALGLYLGMRFTRIRPLTH